MRGKPRFKCKEQITGSDFNQFRNGWRFGPVLWGAGLPDHELGI